MASVPINMANPAQQHAGSIHQHPNMTMTSEEYAHNIYRRVAQDHDVEEFLHQTNIFDFESRRWAIPPKGTIEGLVNSVTRILRSIVGRFARSTRTGVSRTVTTLQEGPGPDVHHIETSPRPMVVIQASGPSFEEPSLTAIHAPSKSFSNVASYIIPMPGSEVGNVTEVVRDMEPHARRIFAQQPNRLFVRCLLLTESHARLVHFDRAGIETTPLIDIHQHPETFVRIIAGLASVDERTLGLDDSIQWTIVNGRKENGTLTTTSPSGVLKTYPILEQIPIPRDDIPGRGTNCWRVQDPDTLEVLAVKDSWQPDYVAPEHELLKLVHDVPGVVQMVSYETGRGETKDFRCPSTAGKCHNRVAMRTVMKSYGKSIEYFTSALQVLCAIRDAIAGHQRLLSGDLKILHRDISHNNILIGAAGTVDGNRGILIDLDMAFRATDERPTVTADFNVGTRIFQSLSVLNTYTEPGPLPPHDYLDDLESFFHVLAYIFLIHRPDGSRVSSKEEGHSIVMRWDHPDTGAAYDCKSNMFGGRNGLIAERIVELNWGRVCLSLYQNFSYWISDTTQDKLEAVHESSMKQRFGPESDEDPLAVFYSQRDEHYTYVLGIFDDAIKAIQATAVKPVAPQAVKKVEPSAPIAPPISPQSDRKAPCPLEASPKAPIDATKTHSPPTSLPASLPPTTTAPCRSVRIQNLRPKPTKQPAVPPVESWAKKSGASRPTILVSDVRPSARILKRTLEGDTQVDASLPVAKRMKKTPRNLVRA